MNLWLCSHFLVAGLFLSTWALTPEECKPLVEPLSLDDPSTMLGRWNFQAAYTDSDKFNPLLKITESSWMNVTASPAGNKEVLMTSMDKMNGTCVVSTFNIALDGVTASATFSNISSIFKRLSSCDDCFVLIVNTTVINFDKLLQKMNLKSDVTGEEFKVYSLYLMSRGSTLKDSDLGHFKQQATCLGFSGEPVFIFDSKNEFCAEGEGTKITF